MLKTVFICKPHQERVRETRFRVSKDDTSFLFIFFSLERTPARGEQTQLIFLKFFLRIQPVECVLWDVCWLGLKKGLTNDARQRLRHAFFFVSFTEIIPWAFL